LGGENNENTIGSRWQKGTIKVFDTYKFVSKSYYDIEYHYRSLDTWLNGICKSFCDIHEWDRGLKEDVDSNKFSIFKIEEAVGASDDDEDEPTCEDDHTHYSGIYIGPGNNGDMIKQYCLQSNNPLLVNVKKKTQLNYYLKSVQTLK